MKVNWVQEAMAVAKTLYSYAWFVSFGVAFVVYMTGMTVFGKRTV
jgi:cytosine/uracil/thiamine/allantoin permease